MLTEPISTSKTTANLRDEPLAPTTGDRDAVATYVDGQAQHVEQQNNGHTGGSDEHDDLDGHILDQCDAVPISPDCMQEEIASDGDRGGHERSTGAAGNGDPLITLALPSPHTEGDVPDTSHGRPVLQGEVKDAWDRILARKEYWWRLKVPAITYIVTLLNGAMRMAAIAAEVDEILPSPIIGTNYSGVAQALSKYNGVWFQGEGSGQHSAKVIPVLIKAIAAKLEKIAAGGTISRRYPVESLSTDSQAEGASRKRPPRGAVRLYNTTYQELTKRKAVLILERNRNFALDETVRELVTTYFQALDQTTLTPRPVWRESVFALDPILSRASKSAQNLTIRPSTYADLSKVKALLIVQRGRDVSYDEVVQELIQCFDSDRNRSTASAGKEVP